MKVSDLLKLPYNEDSDRISMDELNRNVNAPKEILENFLSGHGRIEEVQKQFGHLNLNHIQWSPIFVAANELISCAYYLRYSSYVNSVANRVDSFNKQGWSCLDIREDIVKHWELHGSWQKKPIFLSGLLMQSMSKYYLVEGHTRIGALCGLVKNKILSEQSKHEIWIGEEC